MSEHNQTPEILTNQANELLAALILASADYERTLAEPLPKFDLGKIDDAITYFNTLKALTVKRETLAQVLIGEARQLARVLRAARYTLTVQAQDARQ